MVVTETEFLLVTPDKAKLGWGVVHFICFLQVRPTYMHMYMYMHVRYMYMYMYFILFVGQKYRD